MDKDQYWLVIDSYTRGLDKRGKFGALYLTRFYLLRERFEFLRLIPDRLVFWLCDQAAGVKTLIKI